MLKTNSEKSSSSSLRRSISSRSSDKHRRSVKYQLKTSGEIARSYDFITARPPAKTSNVIESIGYLMKGCLGGGVVTIHESYKDCGLWTALVLNLFLGLAVTYGLYMLVRSAHKMYGRVQVPAMSYSELAEASLQTGPWKWLQPYSKSFRYLVDITIIIDLFGSCCIYQVIIARILKQLVDGSETITNAGAGSSPSLRIYILCLMLPCIILSMATNMKYFEPFSVVANLFAITIIMTTVFYGVKTATVNPLHIPVFKSVPGFFQFLGVCVFSLEGVCMTLTIENNMTNPRNFLTVLIGSMSIVVSLAMLVGFFGSWGFGEKAQSPVTINFPWEPFPIILKVSTALMIYITFALNFWIPFDLAWGYLRKMHEPLKHWIWEKVYRVSHIVVITLIAVTFPNVPKFIGLLGSFCLPTLGFIYPAFIELSLDWEDPGLGYMKWRLGRFGGILIFGLIFFVLGTCINAKELIADVLKDI